MSDGLREHRLFTVAMLELLEASSREATDRAEELLLEALELRDYSAQMLARAHELAEEYAEASDLEDADPVHVDDLDVASLPL